MHNTAALPLHELVDGPKVLIATFHVSEFSGSISLTEKFVSEGQAALSLNPP
ncbi:hypothetical protein K0U27_08780 [archaeon]|nr:hypothetical protein [archaeon]